MNIIKKINCKDGETVVRVVYPHMFAYVWGYILGGAILVAASFFMFKLFFYGWWGQAIYGLIMLFGLYVMFRSWRSSRKNMLVLTNMRVVDIHKQKWFDETISSISYLDVKDVAVRKKGLWHSLADVGGVSIFAKDGSFAVEMHNIQYPVAIQTQISDLAQQYKQDVRLVNNQVIYNNFVKIIPVLPDGDLQEIARMIQEQLHPRT